MRVSLALGAVVLICAASAIAAPLTMPENLRNYTHLLTMISQKPKFGPRTTTQHIQASPGDQEHIDYMFRKYERDFGSLIEDDDVKSAPSPSPGQTTASPRVFTITELEEETLDETHVPDHHILQLINELGNKGLRVFAKLKTINEEQKEEHFPWKYKTQHPEYQKLSTKRPVSPMTFESEAARRAYKNQSEQAALQELFYELKDALEIGEEKKKELLKEKTPTSSESEQMRDHYKQTKQWCEPVLVDYTTWDGGEGNLKLTAASVEREVLSREKITRYDTLEVYHDQKAKEEREFEEYEEEKARYQTETRATQTTKSSTASPIVEVEPNLNEKITVSWDAMSKIMWHYINKVTLPANINERNDTASVTKYVYTMNTRHSFKVSELSNISKTEDTTDDRVAEYMRYLTEIGQTIEPATSNYRIERFPTRPSSEEVLRRKLYSKGPHFVEKFAKRLDSVEMEKRRSRLSTTPTTSTATWSYSTFSRNHYDSVEREGIEAFFRLNNMSTDPNYFGKTTKSHETISTRKEKLVVLNETAVKCTSRVCTHPTNTLSSENTIHYLTRTTPLLTTGTVELDYGKYKDIDIPKLQNTVNENFTNRENTNTRFKATRTMSYNELSSVVMHYAELLKMRDKSLYFEKTTAPSVFTSKNIPVTKKTTLTKATTTTPTSIALVDAHAMTEAPLQHVYNLLFDPFRHDVQTEGPSSPRHMDDSYNEFLKSLGSSPYTEPYLNSTIHDPKNQLHKIKRPTTPKVYSKGEVYAMGHRTYDRNHDPLWRSKYKRGQQSTTPYKSNLMNIFDDPLGLYLRPDSEEQRKKENEKKAKLVNITFIPYWKDFNKKYFASTVTIYPWQFTPRNENDTQVTEFDLKFDDLNSTSMENIKRNNKSPSIEEMERHDESLGENIIASHSEEHYIERRPTTTQRIWRGYHLDSPDNFPSAEEIARRLREGDPMDPEHVLDQRLNERELEDQIEENEDEMPSSSYMNLTHSDQLCRDREPALRFFDDSKEFSSEGFKTLEGWSNETYNQMEETIARQIDELKEKFRQRRLNKTREAEERRKTTQKSSEENERLRMDNIKFKHLENDLQAKHEMREFKNKLKQQFDVIYEHSSTTVPSTPTNIYTPHDTTLPIVLITNKKGEVIRRLKKIKRKRMRTGECDDSKLNFTMEFPFVTETKKRNMYSEELHFRGIMKRSVTSNPFADESADKFIVVTNQHGRVIRKLQRVKKERTTNPTKINFEISQRSNTMIPSSTNAFDKRYFTTTNTNSDLSSIAPYLTVISPIANSKVVCTDGRYSRVSTDIRNTELSSMRSRIIERFERRHFTLPCETTLFTFDTTKNPKYWNSLEKKFYGGEEINLHERTEYANPSLEKIIESLKANLAEGDSNKTLTEEEREIDRVSEKYYKENFAGDIDGFDRDYEGNLVSTLSPAEIQKENDKIEKEKIEYMRKARGEFDRYMSQETYDQLKDQRDVRIKHIEEYIDWQYKEEHEKEQERRRRKKLSTETTPILENGFSPNNTTSDYTTKLAGARRRVEIFKERKFTLPFETTVTIESTQDMVKETIPTIQFNHHTSTVTSERLKTCTDQTITSTYQPTQYRTAITVILEKLSTCWTDQALASVQQQTQSTAPQNTLFNTLVQQLMEYKRFNLNHQTRKTEKRRFTISLSNYTKTTTSTTKTPDYLEYGDYNISTTQNIIHGEQHEDPLNHLTNIQPQVFDAMKLDEDDLYQRYHNQEIDFNTFRELRDKLISRYIVYAKSTTPYTFPTFNITSTVFPTIGNIENYGDLKKAWKKVVAYEKEMATVNDSFLQSAFSLALTNFPPTIPPNKRRRYRRMAKYSSRNKKREHVLKNSNSSSVIFQTTISKQNRKKMSKTKQGQGTTSTRSQQIVLLTSNSASSKRRKAKIITEAQISKKEIKTIQKQLCILKKDLEKLKSHISKFTKTDVCEKKKTDHEYFLDSGVLNSSITKHNESGFERKPFLYARLEKSGQIQKYELELKEIAFEDTKEKEEMEEKFVAKEGAGTGDPNRFLFVWRNVKIQNETAEQERVLEGNQTRNYEFELGSVHPYTLVTMVSNLYHERISLQNHIKYETTTSRSDQNRTYLYELFGFNSRIGRATTRNTTQQFSLFHLYRSTIQANYRRVSNIQEVLRRYTKNLTIFSKRERRLWDVFFYEKNIPLPRHPFGRVRWHVGIAPPDTRALKANRDWTSEYVEEYEGSSYPSEEVTSEEIEREQALREFESFIRERKCIRTTRPMVFAWQMKSSLPMPTEDQATLMNPDPTATHFFFEMCEPP